MSFENSPGRSTSATGSGEHALDGYVSEQQLADELGKSRRTIARWRREDGASPPITRVGRTLYYRRDAVAAWLRSLEMEVE